MGQAFNVSENIGFDGNSYFCRRCGKAGYGKATQVRGHLAMCPGTLMRKGGLSTTSYNQLQPVASGYNAGLSGGQLPQPVAVANSVANQVNNPPVDGYEQLASRVTAMENHYNHVLGQMNQPQYQPAKKDFFSQHKTVLIVGAILFLYLMTNQSRQCSCPSPGQSKGVDIGSIGTKAFAKLVDTSITKGVSSLFK